MCGRQRVALSRAQVVEVAGAWGAGPRWVGQDVYHPSHNVAPGFATPVVIRDAGGEVTVQTMRWGLVPSYTKPGEKPDHFKMFNARSETVAEKPSFRRLVASRRCLVLSEGFYEWAKEKGGKQPYYIYLRGAGREEPMVFAGLWDTWQSEAEGVVHTYTILTTDSSKRLTWLHDRMPVILRDQASQELWLGTQQGDATGKLQRLLVPYNGEDLVWHTVTKAMGSPSFQGPECSKEVKKPSVASFFQPRKPAAGEQAAASGSDGASRAGAGAEAAAAAAAAAVAGEVGGGAPGGAAAVNADEHPATVMKEEGGGATGERASGAASPVASAVQQQQQQQQQQQLQQQQPLAGAGGSTPIAARGAATGGGHSPAGGKRQAGAAAGGGGSAQKKQKQARPAGQPAISQFFAKAAKGGES